MAHSKNILFAGDPHGDFKPLIQAVATTNAKAVVLLGDYDLDVPLEVALAEILAQTEIWWIAGNHDFETPNKHRNLFQSSLADNNLHLKVTEIAGLRIAGLGGIFLGRVWYPPRLPVWASKQNYINTQQNNFKHGEMPLKYQSAIWPDEVDALSKLKADVLVTHEAPGSHRFGFQAITDLAATMGAQQIFHGHLHENYSKAIKQNIQVVGVANSTVADMAGQIIAQP